MANYVTTAKAKKTFGVCEHTLRRWADNGLIASIKTPGGHRLYDIAGYFEGQTNEVQNINKENKTSICYCRVSSQSQKDDLQRQILYMQEKFPNHKIISDIGS
jgi:predicted site-specific integrase-resolvase